MTITYINKTIVSEFKKVGFSAISRTKPVEMQYRVNSETLFYIFPEARLRCGRISFNPVLGFYNIHLLNEFNAMSEEWTSTTNVGHIYMSELDPNHRVWLLKDQLDSARLYIDSVLRVTMEIALPIVRKYDSLRKVRDLLKEEAEKPCSHEFAFFGAAQKYAIAEKLIDRLEGKRRD